MYNQVISVNCHCGQSTACGLNGYLGNKNRNVDIAKDWSKLHENIYLIMICILIYFQTELWWPHTLRKLIIYGGMCDTLSCTKLYCDSSWSRFNCTQDKMGRSPSISVNVTFDINISNILIYTHCQLFPFTLCKRSLSRMKSCFNSFPSIFFDW